MKEILTEGRIVRVELFSGSFFVGKVNGIYDEAEVVQFATNFGDCSAEISFNRIREVVPAQNEEKINEFLCKALTNFLHVKVYLKNGALLVGTIAELFGNSEERQGAIIETLEREVFEIVNSEIFAIVLVI